MRCISICHPPVRKLDASRYPRTCIRPKASTLGEAQAECAAQGGRLCSAAEYTRLCCGSGCLMDKLGVWVDAPACTQPTHAEPNEHKLCPLQCTYGPAGSGGGAATSIVERQTRFKPIAACIVGQVRGFSLSPVYQNSYRTLIAPIHDEADVFFAFSAQSAGNAGVPGYNEYPNQTSSLPPALLELFRPVAVEWARADRRCCKASCEGGKVCSAAMHRAPPDYRCASTAQLGFGQQFNLWRAWQLVADYEHRACVPTSTRGCSAFGQTICSIGHCRHTRRGRLHADPPYSCTRKVMKSWPCRRGGAVARNALVARITSCWPPARQLASTWKSY